MVRREGYTTISLDIPVDLLKQLDEYCTAHYMNTRSACIRMAIKEVIDKDKKNGQS